jgi:DNA-binding LacI/PurR family transcriptional regulator
MVQGPTVYDVAERAGVSIATVSFAFTQPERVRKKTPDIVSSAAVAVAAPRLTAVNSANRDAVTLTGRNPSV